MQVVSVEITPKNVQLIEPDDFDSHRAAIFSGVKDAVTSLFPKAHGGVRMELQDVDYDGPDDFTPQEQKDAILSNKFLTRKLRGTVRLVDEKSGDVLDQQHTTLMHVPWLSPRGTFIHGGNDYAPIHQMRLVPGPYARTLANGQFEVQLNAKPGTGAGYRVLLEPDTAQYKLRVGPQMHAHLYSVLHDMGVPDPELEASWGKDILARNKAKYNPKALGQVYGRLVPAKEQNPAATPAEQAQQLQAAFQRTQLLASTVRSNLAAMLDRVKQASVQADLRASDAHDADDVSSIFNPDLTPEDLRENVNALHGKAGPALAGGAWPDKWSTQQDNLGWLSWYDQYHHGRRTDDDRSQIQRWLRFRRLQLPRFINAPSPRRAFALRNWAIDPEKLLDGDALTKLKTDMQAYKEDKWREWMAKSASFTADDLQAIAQYLNDHAGANISTTDSAERIEEQIMLFVSGDMTPANMAMMQVAALPVTKMAALAFLVRNDQTLDIFSPDQLSVTVKSASTSVTISDPEQLDTLSSFISCA